MNEIIQKCTFVHWAARSSSLLPFRARAVLCCTRPFFCVEAAAVASADAIFRLISPFGSKARTIVSVPEECITLFKIQSYFLEIVPFYLCLSSLHKDWCTAWPSFHGKLLYSEDLLMVIQVTMHEYTDSWNFEIAFYIDSHKISWTFSSKSVFIEF